MTASITPLYDLDPTALTAEQRVDALLESERELARLSARQQRIIAAISDDPFTGEPAPQLDKQYFLEQLRATLGESLDAVRSRVATAGDLVHRLPDSLAALETGMITSRQAWRLADQLRPLDDTAAGKVQEAVLEYMQQRRDHSGFVRKVKREILKHDPRDAEDWTDPTGHHHHVPPATYPIDHTLEAVVSNDSDEPAPDAAERDDDNNDFGTDDKRAA